MSTPHTSVPPVSHRGKGQATPAEGARAALAIAALGVVFGDLGTSPLYTLQECLSGLLHGFG